MAKISFDLAALTADFAAKGGKVAVVAQGIRAIESDRKIYAAMREGTRAMADAVEMARVLESEFHIRHDAYVAAKMSGWSEESAQDYAEHAV